MFYTIISPFILVYIFELLLAFIKKSIDKFATNHKTFNAIRNYFTALLFGTSYNTINDDILKGK